MSTRRPAPPTDKAGLGVGSVTRTTEEEGSQHAAPSYSKLLVATDGSEEAALAATVASNLAERGGSELHVVHAWHEAFGAHPHRYTSWELEARAQAELNEQVRRMKASGATVAGTHLKRGPTIEAVLELAEDLRAGLIVVGSRGLGRVERMVLGSVSEGLVHGADRPVLVVRGGEDVWPPERIVVGDDSFGEVEEAEEFAAGLGKLYEARLVLVRDYQDSAAHAENGGFLTARMVDDVLTGEEEVLNGRVDELEGLLGSRPEVRAFVGDLAGSVLQVDGEQRKPALIVAAPPEATAGRMRIGSPLDKVMRAARGPFLFYPQDRAESSLLTITGTVPTEPYRRNPYRRNPYRRNPYQQE